MYRNPNLTRLRDVKGEEEVRFTLAVNRNLFQGDEGFVRTLTRNKLDEKQRRRVEQLENERFANVAKRTQLDKELAVRLRKDFPSISESQISETLGRTTEREKEILIKELIKTGIRGPKNTRLLSQITGQAPITSMPPQLFGSQQPQQLLPANPAQSTAAHLTLESSIDSLEF